MVIMKVFYCDDDGEYRIYCNICDNLCIERFYRNHPYSQIHTNNIRRKQQLNKCFQKFLYN